MIPGADENWSFTYEVEEREEGFFTRFLMPDGTPREWFGPYPTREKADSEVKSSLEAVVASFTKTVLGLK